MSSGVSRTQIALAVTAALGAAALVAVSNAGSAGKKEGRYAAGDFHNHTTCSDGSISMQKLVKKATDKDDTPWGLDWFVQAGHGGNGNRNCTLVEDPAYPGNPAGNPNNGTSPAGNPADANLPTPAYPLLPAPNNSPQATWAQSIGAAAVKGNVGLNSSGVPNNTVLSSQANPNMWRWQSVQEFQYPVLEYLSALRNQPLFIGLESVVAGHEHASMSVITGQMPDGLQKARLPNSPPYPPVALGNATVLAQWSYCFDRGDVDNSSGGGQNWNCMVPGSLNSADPSWNTSAQKLFPIAPDAGTKGHLKTVEAMKWMATFHPDASYYVPAHLERAGPFNPSGNNGYNIEHLRDFNNTAPDIAFGMETQPGHGASDTRGEYIMRRNGISGVNVDSVGGTTYGGTGVYGAQIGGVWDALLGEGRGFWFFASSDWHNRGMFGPDDRRTSQDFFPGEYQRNYTLVREHDKHKLLKPQTIVDGLRSGNNFAASGQLIDRLAFVACIGDSKPDKGDKGSKGGDKGGKSDKAVEEVAFKAARGNTDIDERDCATMGEKLVVQPGQDIVISIVVRDPSGTNYSPYTFANPSLAQVGIIQPLNAPVLDHVDVIRGMVTSLPKQKGDPDYAGEWPRNWITPYLSGGTPNLATVPAAAKNTSAALIKTFTGATWEAAPGQHGEFKKMTFRIAGVKASQYLRLRGTNMPPNVPFETDANGNPLPDIWTNSAAVNPTTSGGSDGFAANNFLRIPCKAVGTNVPATGTIYTGTAIDGCPNHLPQVSGQKYVAFDVAAWADLWFYSNPIFIEVRSSIAVAGAR